MRIVIPGGSGQVGEILARHFHARGDKVTVLSRKPATTPWTTLCWDGRTQGAWSKSVEDANAVINLAGRSVNCRYSKKNRQEILNSRVDSTRAVGQAIAHSAKPPRLWLQAGTATIYSHRYDAPNDERTGIIGGDERDAPDTWRFSIDVAKAWEEAVDQFETPSTRKVILRSAMTMSPDAGGVFDALRGLVKAGLGGRAGDGRQYVSWIHELDFVRAVDWLISRDSISGPVNLASPNPLSNSEFMRDLRAASGARFGLPASAWMLEIGAIFMRTETELILKSRRVVPARLLDSGFAFQFPIWRNAADDLCLRWKRTRQDQ